MLSALSFVFIRSSRNIRSYQQSTIAQTPLKLDIFVRPKMSFNLTKRYICSECGILANTSADAENISFRGIMETITVLAAFGFLKIIEYLTSLVDLLPVFGFTSLIMKRVMLSFLFYLAKETKEEKPNMSDEVQIPTDDFDKIFPVLMDDLVKHTKEYGVPKDTLDWFHNVGICSVYHEL